MNRRQVVSGDVTLSVSEWGDPSRPTVVLVHGYPDTSAVWWPVAERLAGRYHVVAYDVRGAGASSAPRHTRDYRLELLVGDLLGVIDATSPTAPVHLVGHDWGSIQGWEAVTTDRASGRIRSYTSIYAPGIDHAASWARHRLTHPTPRHLSQLAGQQVRSWYIVAFHLPGAAHLGRALAKRVEKGSTSPDYPAATVSADAVRGVALYRANFRTRLTRPSPRPTDVPVQVIVPLRDPYVSPALSDGLERWAPRLWRTEIAAGHWVARSHPAVVSRWIGELVDHIEGGPESRRLQRSRVSPSPIRPARPAGGTGGGEAHAGEGDPEARRDAATPGQADAGERDPEPLAGPTHQAGRAFAGHLVVITGAGGGIGRAVAVAFAEQGAAVVATDIDGAAAARTAALAGALGAESHHRQVDVSDAAAMEDLASWVGDDLGGADIVVNNAGIGMAGPMLDTTVEDWSRILNVNLWGVIHGSRLFGRQMVDRAEGGHIVNVASMAAYAPSRSYPAYATTKAAALMLSQCLDAELAGARIRVHAICPGFVDTGISTATRYVGVDDAEQDRLRQLAAHFYHRRAMKPEVVADAVLDAIQTGVAVMPVGRDAKFGWSLSHWWPGVSRRLAEVDFISR